jgi:Tfp pilus assembly protein PilN
MSFVQFNLLPDVKLEFNRSQHAKKVVYTLCALVTGIALAVLIISFFTVAILQKKLLSDANNDINKYSKQLKSIPDLDKVLTIQNQLTSLPALHSQKHITSRIYGYLPQITPVQAHIGQITLDLNANTITVNGQADSVKTVNAFVDTLKFTNFAIGSAQPDTDTRDSQKPAFSNVILTSVARSDKGANYTISASFDPALFDGSQNVFLVVPNQITTRSVINTPDINNLLFNGETDKSPNQQGGQ